MLDLNSFFDKIYCINLDERKDRWTETTAELTKWGIGSQVSRFSAVNGSALKNTYPVNNGELGLILTHEKIIQEASDKNYQSILILEDDIQFTDGVIDLPNYFEALPDDWDILWFGANHNVHCGNKIELINNKIIKCNKAFSTHCIAFNHTIYTTALELIANKQKAVDVYYWELQQSYNCYAFNPSLAVQRPSYSDIQKEHQDNRWLF